MISSLIPIIVNFSLVLVSLIVTIIVLSKVKFDDGNYRLLFLLYLMYWIAPMMLRQYTSKIHSNLCEAGIDSQSISDLVWVPTLVYGVVGIFWKPIADLLAFKFKSRKSVIFIALSIQVIGVIPMIIKPCFFTNIIQSFTVGIGAAGIAMFNLMFNEQYAKKKVFATVSLLSLPPMIAEFTSAALISCVTSFVPNQGDLSDVDFAQKKVSILKWIWIVALIMIVLTYIVSIFIKENKELVFADNKYKEPVSSKWEVYVIVLVLFIGMFSTFVKYCTSGGSMLNEIEYIAKVKKIEGINKYSAYLSPLLYVGRTTANLLTGFVLIKKFKKVTLFSIASFLWLIFAVLSGVPALVNIPAKFALTVINGFAFGMVSNLISNAMMKKYFAKTSKVTPVTLLSVMISIGVVVGSFLNTFIKKPFLKDKSNINETGWNGYIKLNLIMTCVVCCSIILMWILFICQAKISENHQQSSSQQVASSPKNKTHLNDGKILNKNIVNFAII